MQDRHERKRKPDGTRCRHPRRPTASIAELEALRREADEHRDRYLRAVAELDNFRKRSAREVDAARKFGAERLAQAILPVRDSLEAGLAAAEKAGQPALLDGQRATLRLLDEALARCRHPRDQSRSASPSTRTSTRP